MSKTMGKKGKRVLIALVIVALLGCCFTAVGLYARNELSKPKFTAPGPKTVSAREYPKIESVRDLSDDESKTETADKSAVFDYIRELYEHAVSADDVETSWHTDVKLKDYSEPMKTPFAEADEKVIAYILKQAGDQLKNSVYPKEDKVLKSSEKGVFRFDLTEAQIKSFTAEQGRFNDRSEYVDDEYYYITFEIDPSWIDTDAIPDSETFAKFKEVLAPAFILNDAKFETRNVKISCKVARLYDELVSLDITRSYWVKASITLQDAYSSLLSDVSTSAIDVELPYESTEKIEFFYYGAHFTQKWIAVQPGDWQAIPARVQVHENELPENFTMTYTVSDPNVMSIDADGVMRVEKKGVEDEEVTVRMTLEYCGHIYSDELLVYITTMEVTTDE